ncbi:MAG TPA: hypothetical protein VN699_10050, partial [Pirellulales bacterium]|nr:hypothetical protein [Pirellulales bacterium]
MSDDVGLCIETDGLAEHLLRFADGPLYQRLTHFPPLARSVGENGPKIALALGEFQKRFGASPLDVWAGILGGRALFAVWPPTGESQNGPALLLVEAKDGELLDHLLDKFVTLQRSAGKLQKTWMLTHGGRPSTVHRFGSDENGDQLYLTSVGKLGIAANSEALIRDTFALISREGATRRPLSEFSGYVAGNGRLSPQIAIRLFVNPRPWDAGLLADFQRKAPESDDAQFQKAVIETWRATEYVTAGLQLDSDATLEAFAAWNASALPGPLRETAESVGGRAVLVDHVPGDALAAVAGRVDFGRLAWRFGLLGPLLKKTAGRDAVPAAPPERLLLGSLAQGIGPNFGAYLVVRPTGDAGALESPLPLDWVAGLETRPLEPGDARPSLARLA